METKYSEKKRELQRMIFNLIDNKEYTEFVGLMGDEPLEYLKIINPSKYRHVYLFEIKDDLIKKWKPIVEKLYSNITVSSSDITKVKVTKNTFCDYDFCGTLKTIRSFLPTITNRKKFSLTITTRGCGEAYIKKSLKECGLYIGDYLYLDYMKEKKINVQNKGASMVIIYKFQ